VAKQLPPTGSVSARLSTLETTIYDTAVHQFGHLVRPVKNHNDFNHQKKKTIELVDKKNNLISRIEEAASCHEITALQLLLDNTREHLRKLRRVNNKRRRKWLRNKARADFRSNPYKCGKELLKPRSNVRPFSPQGVLDQFLDSQYSDSLKDLPLPPLIGLPPKPPLNHKFNGSAFTSEEFFKLLGSRRNGSAWSK